MNGKIRYLGVREFGRHSVYSVENEIKIQKRETRPIFCMGEESPEDAEFRNVHARKEISENTATPNSNKRQRFVVGDDDLQISQQSCCRLKYHAGDSDLNTAKMQGKRLKFVRGDEDLAKVAFVSNRRLQLRPVRTRQM